MTSERLARVIAVVLGPQTWLPVLYLILLFNTGLGRSQMMILVPVTLLLSVVIPLAYLYFAPKLGWVSVWDMKERAERGRFLILVLVLNLAPLVLIRFFGSQLLFDLLVIMIVLLVAIFIINSYWKISQHMVLNVAGALFINYLFGWSLPALYFFVPIIFWARLKLGKHTVGQLIAGGVISLVVVLGGLSLIC